MQAAGSVASYRLRSGRPSYETWSSGSSTTLIALNLLVMKSPSVACLGLGNAFAAFARGTRVNPLWSSCSSLSLTAKVGIRRPAKGPETTDFNGLPGRAFPFGQFLELWFFSPQVKHVLSAMSTGGFLHSAFVWFPWQFGHF